MPNWKKLIYSGSDASLNSLYVNGAVTASSFSGSHTGSLLGTASWAQSSSANIVGGTTGRVPYWNSTTSITASDLYYSSSGQFIIGGVSAAGTTAKLSVNSGILLGSTTEVSTLGLRIGDVLSSNTRISSSVTPALIQVAGSNTDGSANAGDLLIQPRSDTANMSIRFYDRGQEILKINCVGITATGSLQVSGSLGHILTGNSTINGKLTVGQNTIDTNNQLYVYDTTPFAFYNLPSASVRIGARGTGGSLIVETPSLNSTYGSGFAVSGSYDTVSKKSEVNLIGYGVWSGGSYYSDLVFNTTLNQTMNTQMRISGSGRIIMGGNADLAKALTIATSTKGELNIGTLGISDKFGIQAYDSSGNTKPIVLQPNTGSVSIGQTGTLGGVLHIEGEPGYLVSQSIAGYEGTPSILLTNSGGGNDYWGRIWFAQQTSRTLTASGSARIESSRWGIPASAGVDQADLRFTTAYGGNFGERLRIDARGNVIINATMPVSHSTAYRLFVSGNVNITNALTVTGSLSVTGSSHVISGTLALPNLASATVTNVVGYNTTTGQLTYQPAASSGTETDPIFTAKSGSLATTGSNTFSGSQIVSGSLTIFKLNTDYSSSTATTTSHLILNNPTGSTGQNVISFIQNGKVLNKIRTGQNGDMNYTVTGSVTAQDGYHAFWTGGDRWEGGTIKMVIIANGNVGIGTQSPQYTLDVSGSGNYTNGLTVTGSLIVGSAGTKEFEVTTAGTNIGNAVTDNHNITGSVNISGSLLVNTSGQTEFQVTSTGTKLGNAVTDAHSVTGSLTLSGSLYISGAAGNSIGYIQTGTDGMQLGNGNSGVHITLRASNRTEFGQSVGMGNPGFGYTTSDKLSIKTTDSTVASTGLWVGNSSNLSLFKVYGSGLTQIPSGSLQVTGSPLTQPIFSVYGSGSDNPLVAIQGSQGELFSITDSMSGSLFSVNNSSGLPVIEAFSDSTIKMGIYPIQSMYTTNQIITAASAANTIYQIATGSYDAVWMDYVARSGSLYVRTGQFMTTWSGSRTTFTDISASSLPTATSSVGLAFSSSIAGGYVTLYASSSTPTWTIKTIIRTI
jgi:hypothetical protein